MRRAALVIAAVGAVVMFAACSTSSGDPPVDPTGSCAELASRCHSYSKESAFADECHELGHAGDDNACGPRKADCLAACPPREGGTVKPTTDGGEAGASDAEGGSDAGPDGAIDQLCVDHCACLADTCTAITGYPFVVPGSCAAQCAQLGAPERACWPKWCTDAKASTTTKAHLCEHAWGLYGLDECP